MTNIAETIKNLMIDNGLDKVKIYNDDSKCIVVQGKLNTDYIVTFKSNNNEDDIEYYTVLKNRIDKRTTTIWNNTSIESFPSIINVAKLYITKNSSNTVKNTSVEEKKSHYQLIMPIGLTVGIVLCGIFGIFLGNKIRNLCSKNENIELIR